jgi:uncharacterized membrane protein
MSAFLGSFHPLLVHLPIGILLFAGLADLWSLQRRKVFHRASLQVLYGVGAIAAAASCISGYLLSQDGSYEGPIVDRHQWLGISSAIIAAICWYRHRPGFHFPGRPFSSYAMPVVLLLLLTAAGHAGGSLTHGEGYLLSSAPAFLQRWAGYDKAPEKQFTFMEIREASAYPDVAAVIFAQRCEGCHGPGKQKGGLRLDAPEWLTRGGKNGDAFVPGNPGQSLLIQRMLLPIDDEDHMPPKEKPQPSKAEIAFLQWWITQGGDFTQKVGDAPLPDSLHRVFASLGAGKGDKALQATPDLPPEPAAPASTAVMDSLEKLGILVLPVASGSANLDINLINCTMHPDSALALLEPLAAQAISLHTAGQPVTDKGLASIGKLTRLRRLNLAHASISDKGLQALGGLEDLRYLNLTYTALHAEGLQQLGSLRALRTLYLNGTALQRQDWTSLQQFFPKTTLDSGGYRLPKLASDTEKVREKKR